MCLQERRRGFPKTNAHCRAAGACGILVKQRKGGNDMFTLPEYCAPDFSAPLLQNAPSVRTAPAPADGAAPAGYHATGMYPEYYKVDGV